MVIRRYSSAPVVAAVGLAATLILGACGGDSSPSSTPESPLTEAVPTTAPVTTGDVGTPPQTSEPTDAFPITITHELGSTVIPQPPQRVVALNNRFRDAAFALGVTPLPARPNAEGVYSKPRPWAPFAADWETSTVLFTDAGLDYKAIAALKPDLILHGVSSVPPDTYDELSKIAPTVVRAEGTSDVSWQQVTRAAGAALGRSAGAETVVAEMEARLAKVASENPGFKGRSVAYASYSSPQADIYVTNTQGTDMEFFSSLGFTVAQMSTRVQPGSFDDLDVDVLIWDLATQKEERATIEADPRLNSLSVMKEGRAAYIDGDLAFAFTLPSVLSLQYALEQITPLLQAVPN